MADIYEGCLICIAATWSNDSNGGCFSQVRSMYRGYQLGDSGLFARFATDDLLGVRGHPESPLFDRGWVFQERSLSPRVVYYSKDQLFWECGSSVFSECGMHNRGHEQRPMINQVLKFNQNELDRGKYWRRVIQRYSSLEFTKSSDFLPGLAGIVERESGHRERKHDVYMAGMWRNKILDDIAFYTRYPRNRPGDNVPTWSWASLGSRVTFDEYEKLPTLKLLEVSFEHVGRHSLGQGTNASLRLKGPVLSAFVGDPEAMDDMPSFAIVLDLVTGLLPNLALREEGYVNFSGLTTGSQLLLLVLFSYDFRCLAMILHEASNGRFRRLGVIRIVLEEENMPKVSLL